MIRKLGAQLKEYKFFAFITPLCMILEVIAETVTPRLMGLLVDNGVEKGDISYIVKVGIMMLFCALFGLAAGLAGGFCAARASTGFSKNLRKAMYDNIQTFSFSNIDKFSTAGLVTRLTTDVTNVQNAFQMLIRMSFRAPFSLVFAMTASFMVSARIARIYLMAVIILAVIIVFIMLSAMKSFRQVFKKYDDLNSTIQENVNAIRVVKAYVREDYEKSRMYKACENIYKLFVNAESRVVLNAPIMMTAVYTCILLISWVGAHMIVSDELTTGDLMTLLTYCMNILMNLMMLSMIFVMLSMSMASGERIVEVLDERPDIVNPEEPLMSVRDGSIEFEDVDFSYYKESESMVLKDISLKINSGETVGIIGGTGSGKTSLVNLICRLYDASLGVVKVGGRNVKEYDLEVLRKEVSVVLQKNVLFSGTIMENLRWGNKDASEDECIRACKMACADEFIEKMPDKYDTYIEQGGTNVSGGQKQRLCIARALLKKPKILILDDSTSAVDTATDAGIRRAFYEEIPDVTKIIIAQRVSSVQDADRIIVMEDGRINGVGTHEELLNNNVIYKDVYESQMGERDFDGFEEKGKSPEKIKALADEDYKGGEE
ncbi:MAG: ABC transporter ATP-binding protein/permease [Lachnospiraceae bacterium]|nr:ABC transporter ATP-binding protein/permease [Lachnospiraceae bacterium]